MFFFVMCIGSQFDGRVVVDRFEIMDIWNFFFFAGCGNNALQNDVVHGSTINQRSSPTEVMLGIALHTPIATVFFSAWRVESST